jgi:hypothetical protein
MSDKYIAPLDERIAGYRKSGKYPTAIAIYDFATGLKNDLRLEEIRIAGNKRFNDEGRQAEMRDAAAPCATKLTAHRNTLMAAKHQNAAAKSKLAEGLFKPSTDMVKSLWDMKRWDRLDAMPTHELLKLGAADPEALRIMATSPMRPKNLPETELARLIDNHLEKVDPRGGRRHRRRGCGLGCRRGPIGRYRKCTASRARDATRSGAIRAIPEQACTESRESKGTYHADQSRRSGTVARSRATASVSGNERPVFENDRRAV